MVFVLPDLSSAVFWAALWKIIIANIILSGDNAVVIAMACHNLSDKYRKPAIFFGSALGESSNSATLVSSATKPAGGCGVTRL